MIRSFKFSLRLLKLIRSNSHSLLLFLYYFKGNWLFYTLTLLLPGDRTSHSRFKIPLNVYPDSVCPIKKNSDLAAMLRQCSLIIWGKVPMQHRHYFETVGRNLQDICSNFESLFGGILVVLGGDFAQIGPVVKHGQRHHIVEASLAKSIEIWPNLKKLKLTENMRLSGSNPIDQSFSQWIGSLSYNSLLNGKIFLPHYVAQYHSLTTFVDSIYPKEIMEQTLDPEFFQERAITAPKNDLVDEINRYVLDQLPGNQTSLFAVDRITQEDSAGSEDRQMPTEYLQSLNPHGLPPSVLELKIGMPIMILRNINAEKGLCNGTLS